MKDKYKEMLEEKMQELKETSERLEDAIYANVDSEQIKDPEWKDKAFLTS